MAKQTLRHTNAPASQEHAIPASGHLRLLITLDVLVALLALGAWISMIAGLDGGVLSLTGFRSLRYFTVLSNILAAVCCFLCAIFEIRMPSKAQASFPTALHVLRFISVNGIMLTFMVVMLYLGPALGYPAVLTGGNLFLHLIVPLCALATLLIAQSGKALSAPQVPLGLIPALAYATFYAANILINGLSFGIEGTDWYNFTIYGTVSLPVSYAIITAFCLVLAYALWFASGGRPRPRRTPR